MGAMKVLAILLSCGAVVFSQNRGDIVKNDFGDFSSRFVGPSPPISGGSSNNFEIQQKGVSPNGNFFAPGVQVLPDPAPFFRPASNVGPIGNAGGLFPMENIGGPSFDNIGGPNNFDNERGPFSFGGDLPFIPDEGFGNVGPEHNGPGPFGPGPFGPGPLGAGPLGPGPIGREDFGPGPMGPVNIGPGHIGHRNMGPSYPSRIGTEFKHDDFVTDQVNNFRSSPIVRGSSSSRDSVAGEAKRFRSSPVVSLLPSGSGNGGSEALNNIAQAIQPTREIDGKRYEPMFKEFPDIFLSNEGKDSCFAKLKKVFDKSYPKLPEVERSNDPISYPHPRLAFKLPPFVNPIYRYAINNNVQYVPYKISTSPAPIFVPFTRDSNKLLFPTLPIYLPYVKISINVPEQKRQYFPYIPFQPDKDRIPSQSCSQSRILLPIPGNPKELYSVAAYTLVALQGNQGKKSMTFERKCAYMCTGTFILLIGCKKYPTFICKKKQFFFNSTIYVIKYKN